jgi:hypothetical protein
MKTECVPIEDVRPLSGAEYERLEDGAILFFAEAPVEIFPDDRDVLLNQKPAEAAYHKNVAYRPLEDRLTGGANPALHGVMKRFSANAVRSLQQVLPQYAAGWSIDYASFRPQEEAGRQLKLHARNDLVHIDAFPSRPTNGARILRLFVNLNPVQNRVWVTGDTFDALAERFARDPRLRRAWESPSLASAPALRGLLTRFRVPAARRSPYDRFMLAFHNFLKENDAFQRTCSKQQFEFPPNSSWLVFTDTVSHSVLSGQYALEQTLIVPRELLRRPDRAPIGILERIAARPLTVAS